MANFTLGDIDKMFPPSFGGNAQISDLRLALTTLVNGGTLGGESGNLLSSGSIPMDNGYSPINSLDISTKEYSDAASTEGSELSLYTVGGNQGWVIKGRTPQDIGQDAIDLSQSYGDKGAVGNLSLTIGYGTKAEGYAAFAGGEYSQASEEAAFAFGYAAQATGTNAVAMGDTVYATAYNSLAFGQSTEANGAFSHAEGKSTYANGEQSFTSGAYNRAESDSSFVIGTSNMSANYSASSEIVSLNKGTKTFTVQDGTKFNVGDKIIYYYLAFSRLNLREDTVTGVSTNNITVGNFLSAGWDFDQGFPLFNISPASNTKHSSQVFGSNSIAGGTHSFATGLNVIASSDNMAVFGKFNNPKINTILEVGNGTNKDNRKNAFEVYSNGNIQAPGLTPAIAQASGNQSLVPLSYLFSPEFGNAIPTSPGTTGTLYNNAGVLSISP